MCYAGVRLPGEQAFFGAHDGRGFMPRCAGGNELVSDGVAFLNSSGLYKVKARTFFCLLLSFSINLKANHVAARKVNHDAASTPRFR